MEELQTSIITLLGFAFLVTVFVIDHRFSKTINKINEDLKKLGKKIEEKEDQPYQNVTKQKPMSMFRGLVECESKRESNGGLYWEFHAISSRMPKFTTVPEVTNYAIGVLSGDQDPTEVNLAGRGPVMKTVTYHARGTLMRFFFEVIAQIEKGEPYEPEEETNDSGGEGEDPGTELPVEEGDSPDEAGDEVPGENVQEVS